MANHPQRGPLAGVPYRSHADDARELLASINEDTQASLAPLIVAAAQVHATLALVAQVESLKNRLAPEAP